MVKKTVDVVYNKSPLWRVVSANNAAVGGLGGPTGMDMIMRFSIDWVDVEKETFVGEVDMEAGTMAVLEAAKVHVTPMMKLEEVAVRMPLDGAVNLLIGLLGQNEVMTEPQRQRIRDEVAKFPKA